MGVDSVARVATVDEIDAAAQPLAHSHIDDPGMSVFFPDRAVRVRALDRVFHMTVADAVGFGAVYVASVDDRISATAAWLPPGAFPPGTGRAVASAPDLLRIFRIAPRGFPSFMRFSMKAAEQARGQRVWFLAGLGTAPGMQGKGLGARVLTPVLDRADRDGEVCMLNTQNERNIAYYRRFGFEVAIGPWRAGAGPDSWTMRRRPVLGE